MKPRRTSDGGASRRHRVLLVDDHPMMREGLTRIISTEPDLEVCGEAADGMQAIEAVRVQHPDLVLLDISLPGKSGLDVLKDLRALDPGLRVLVISMHNEAIYAERVLRAGGRGYIMKHEDGRKILDAIRQVLGGKVYLSERMAAQVLETFSGRRADSGMSPVEQLTDREFEVFRLIGQGRSTKEIATELHLSTKTVEVHRIKIKSRLKLQSAVELTHYAVRWTEAQHPTDPGRQ